MTKAPPLSDQQRSVLEPFVLRARRLMAHSLMQDVDQLELFAKPRFEFNATTDENGKPRVEMHRPAPQNEEQVESAAARVRPLFLKEESVHYAKVLKAMRGPNRTLQVEFVTKGIDNLAVLWKTLDPYSDVPPPNEVTTSWTVGGADGDPIGMRRLAWAYIYGDVVHMDNEQLAATAAFGVRERYYAASVLVCRALLATRATLRAVRTMVSGNYLVGLDASIFSEAVVADLAPLEVAMVAQAPIGTPPSPGGPDNLGPEWTSIMPQE